MGMGGDPSTSAGGQTAVRNWVAMRLRPSRLRWWVPVLLLGCAKQPPSGSTEVPPSSGAPVVAVTSSPMAGLESPKHAATAASVAQPANAGGGAAAPSDAVVTKLSEWQTEVEGCLALKGAEPRVTRSAVRAADEVRVESAGGYVRVAHHLSHACCLNSETRVERAAGVVRLTERLTGSPCRCQCDSTIKTRFRLEASDRELSVRLEDKAAAREVHRVALPAPTAATAPPSH
jgi:hypothetical protein